jgi:succinate dehydrogenase hydrophobic anchor subunit
MVGAAREGDATMNALWIAESITAIVLIYLIGVVVGYRMCINTYRQLWHQIKLETEKMTEITTGSYNDE